MRDLSSSHPSLTETGCMRVQDIATGRVFDHGHPADVKVQVDQGTLRYVARDTPLTAEL